MSDDFYVPKTNKGLFAYASGWIVALVALFAVIGIVMAVGTYALNWFAAPYQGKLQARQQIQGSGDYRIQAYNHFFDLCSSITTSDQALQQTLANEKVDKGQSLQIDRTNYTAQLNNRDDAANQYNQDAQKDYTVGQFKASKLPFQIPAYQKGKVYQCAG